MNLYDQNFKFLMFDDAVEMSIQQANILATLGSDIIAIYFNHKLESNPFFDLDRVHEKEAKDDYIRLNLKSKGYVMRFITFLGIKINRIFET